MRAFIFATVAIGGAKALGSGDGSSIFNACEAQCEGAGGSRKCTFHAKINVYASSTGYYQFEECGDTNSPTIAIEQNVEYTIFQNDPTNWYHPMGFAYLPDGALKDHPEIEPGISMSGSNCVDDNTCQAPMYFRGSQFLGEFDDEGKRVPPPYYPSPGNGGHFGIYPYEPEFTEPRQGWKGLANSEGYYIKLKITDTEYVKDLFYFCHVHNNMSGRIKMIPQGGGSLLLAIEDPPLGYFYEPEPSGLDAECGTFGLDKFAGEKQCDKQLFFCGEGESEKAKHFGKCLHAMDCSMYEEMRTRMHPDDPTAAFIHQMIPHHENAVNMAKAILNLDVLNGRDPGSKLNNLFWDIINVQNAQVHDMERYLRERANPGSTCDYYGTCFKTTVLAAYIALSVTGSLLVACAGFFTFKVFRSRASRSS